MKRYTLLLRTLHAPACTIMGKCDPIKGIRRRIHTTEHKHIVLQEHFCIHCSAVRCKIAPGIYCVLFFSIIKDISSVRQTQVNRTISKRTICRRLVIVNLVIVFGNFFNGWFIRDRDSLIIGSGGSLIKSKRLLICTKTFNLNVHGIHKICTFCYLL